jgi:hypothetical protein
MATTATVVSDQQLDVELQRQRRELSQLREKEQAELRKLDAAKSEHARVFEAIERGVTGKETELSRAKEAVETCEIRAGGIAKQISPIEQKIRELGEESGRRAAAAAKIVREQAFVQRIDKGKALALKIREIVSRLCINEMRELEELRGRLIAEFPDIGGVEAASGLREIIVKHARPSEKLRNPEVHLAQLEEEGSIQFGFDVSDGMVRGTVQGEPDRRVTRLSAGAPVRLTVVAMRPRA